ncbi:MAG: hypothetical protein EHM80_15195 [Nitrospiraceae bacterium]|nr:MAG: hypothetical protein EHM80_15195 [Nitrospiraceae bacterium]
MSSVIPYILYDAMLATTVRSTILLLISLPLLGLVDVPSHSVEIFPHWKKGDRVHLEITRARVKSADGASTITGKTHTHFTIEVLSANDDGYRVGWTAGETIFDSPSQAEHSFLGHVVNLMNGRQIILEIDSHGAIRGVQNWKGLKAAALKSLDALAATENAQNKKSDKALMSSLRAQWESMLRTKEQVEELCTREAQAYFKVLGRGYAHNEPFEYEDLLPNPIGGEAFPTHASMALKTFDKQAGRAVITWRQTTDPKQVARILESMIKEMSARLGREPLEREFPAAISMEDHAEIVVDVATGWVKTLKHARSVNFGTRAQVDTTSIIRTAK